MANKVLLAVLTDSTEEGFTFLASGENKGEQAIIKVNLPSPMRIGAEGTIEIEPIEEKDEAKASPSENPPPES